MRVRVGEILWHEKQRVLSVDYDLTGRLVTGGSDNNVNIWKITVREDDGSFDAELLASLSRHARSVNAVRFAPCGEMLASGGDDGTIFVWRHDKEKDNPDPQVSAGSLDDKPPDKECWTVVGTFRGQEDVYDLAWSPDSLILASASTDCSVRIWDLRKFRQLQNLTDHTHYVQGVAWDPRGRYLLSQSSDRSCRLYDIRKRGKGRQLSAAVVLRERNDDPKEKLFLNESVLSFFRRPAWSPCGRLLFLPTGQRSPATAPSATVGSSSAAIPSSSLSSSLPPPPPPAPTATMNGSASPLKPVSSTPTTTPSPAKNVIVLDVEEAAKQPPSAIDLTSEDPARDKDGSTKEKDTSKEPAAQEQGRDEKAEEKAKKEKKEEKPIVQYINGTYVFSVHDGVARPLLFVPCGSKPSVAVRCAPLLFKLREGALQLFDLPYRVIYAVATLDTVFIHDTQSLNPIGMISGIHFAGITDLAWSPSCSALCISSSDGYCSIASFSAGELGTPLSQAEAAQYVKQVVFVAQQFEEAEQATAPPSSSTARPPSAQAPSPSTATLPAPSASPTPSATSVEEGASKKARTEPNPKP